MNAFNFVKNNNPAEDSIPADLDSLLQANRAGTISPQEQERLENYLKNNTAATNYYLSSCALESAISEALPAGEAKSENRKNNIVSFVRRFRFFVAAGIAAAAVVSAIFLRHNEQTQVAGDGAFCRIANVFGASFQNQSIDTKTVLNEGIFSIDAGAAELVFGQGARILLEAPAALEITGANACRLVSGKAVVDVPDSAKGFVMTTPTERVIDYGTRFAVNLTPDKTFVGVLSGVVDVAGTDTTVRLYTDYAIEHKNGKITSVPLNRSDFLTEMPAREFAWNFDGAPLEVEQTLRFDITPLMKIPGDEICVIYKWLTGTHALRVEELSLECDGKTVQTLKIQGCSGGKEITANNNLILKLPQIAAPANAHWVVVAKAFCDKYPHEEVGDPATSRGVFLFEKGFLKNAGYSDFVGRWVYSHNGNDYIREFLPDGTYRFCRNGKECPRKDVRCDVENGILTITFHDRETLPEKVMLRDNNTLIFLNCPYRNAIRER